MTEYLSKEEQRRLGVEASKCNTKAFDDLYRHFQLALLGHIKGRVGNSKDAEDIAQESWEYCLKKKHTYNPQKGSFYTFLLIFARFKIMRYYAKKRRWNELFILISEFPELKENPDIAELNPTEDTDKPVTNIASSPIDPVIHKEMLCLVLTCCAKPHQVITFGYSQLLEWKPSEIVAELSSQTLLKLFNNLSHDERLMPVVLDDDLTASCTFFFTKLKELVKIVYIEKEYDELRAGLSDMLVGLTELRSYYGEIPTASISDWSYKVKGRVRKIVNGDLNPCSS